MGGYGPPPGPPGPLGPPGWGPPSGPPRKPNNGGAAIVIILAAIVVLVGGGAGLWWMFDLGAKSANSAIPSYTPFTPPTFSPPPVPSFTPLAPITPTYSPAFDPQPGDCVKNTGSYYHPTLSISRCTPGHYRIIDRIDGTTDKNRCASTGYTYAVWYYSPKFVLCMRGL